MKELAIKESLKDCDYCIKKKEEMVRREEEIEKEKVIECRKALEKEKIDKGQHFTKEDELKLRQIQKLQMLEKKNIDNEQRTIDKLWHEMLLEEIKIQEEKEKYEVQLSKQEMQKRRQAYDAQIASANKQRQKVLEYEREIENRRLKQMKERMEQEYCDALERKKRQMLENKKNFLRGHEMKVNRLKYEKELERNIDLKNIKVSNEELRREKENKLERIRQLQIEKQIFLDNFQIEKNMSEKLNKETELVASDWRMEQDNKIFAQLKKLEEEKSRDKEEALREYKKYVETRNIEFDKKRQKRREVMESVKRTALRELQRNMDSANEELRKQIEYRKKLTQQIYENQRVLEMEQNQLEQKQIPFTRKATTFKDAMINKLKYSSQRGTPVHPFTKTMTSETKHNNNVFLPSLDKTFY